MSSLSIPYMTGLNLYTLLLAIAALVTTHELRGRIILGGLIAGLAITIFPSASLLALSAVYGGLAAVAAMALGWRSRSAVEGVCFATLVTYASLTTLEPRPLVMGAMAVPAVLLARWAPVRPPAQSLPHLELIGLCLLQFFGAEQSAWNFIYTYIPGASSMYFISRGALMLLIPWSIGIALFLDRLRMKGHAAIAAGLALCCLIEQGVSTPSFDKLETRAFVSALALRVRPGDQAFYYSPHDSSSPPGEANLDAMWAGLETGVPTINGFTGSKPANWSKLFDSNIKDPCDADRLGAVLGEWKAFHGLSSAPIRWVGGPSEAVETLEGP
jgi:hypothetical protein